MNFTIRKNEVNPSGSLDQSNDIIKKLLNELIEIKASGNILLKCNIELVFKQSKDDNKSEEDIEMLLDKYLYSQNKMNPEEFILFAKKLFALIEKEFDMKFTFLENATSIKCMCELNLTFIELNIPYQIDYKTDSIPVTDSIDCGISKFWVIRR